jgi:hypothetical protein
MKIATPVTAVWNTEEGGYSIRDSNNDQLFTDDIVNALNQPHKKCKWIKKWRNNALHSAFKQDARKIECLGKIVYMDDWHPNENGYKYCPYCGGEIDRLAISVGSSKMETTTPQKQIVRE